MIFQYSSLILTYSQTDTLFHTYSQFGSVPNIPPKPSEDERQTESKLQEILEKVWELLLVQMTTLMFNSARNTHRTIISTPLLRSNSHSFRDETKQPFTTQRSPSRTPAGTHTAEIPASGCPKSCKPVVKCQE
jgi:hypothetical protein